MQNKFLGKLILYIHYIIFFSLSSLSLFSQDLFTLLLVSFNLIIIYVNNRISKTCPLTLMEQKNLGKDSVSTSAKYFFKSCYSIDKKSILQLQVILMGLMICIAKIIVIIFNKQILFVLHIIHNIVNKFTLL